MMWKSLKEEYPFQNDEFWLKWTEDGVNYKEEIIHESKINTIHSLNVPEWRPLDAPEWMNEKQKAHFDATKGPWREKVSEFEGISIEADK